MDNFRKWHLAWAQFDAFEKNLPSSIREKHVVEYHGILDLLHEVTGEDVSAFRIPDDELKRKLTSKVPGRPHTATYSDDRFCDRGLMSRRLDAVRGYFERIQPPEEKPKMGF